MQHVPSLCIEKEIKTKSKVRKTKKTNEKWNLIEKTTKKNGESQTESIQPNSSTQNYWNWCAENRNRELVCSHSFSHLFVRWFVSSFACSFDHSIYLSILLSFERERERKRAHYMYHTHAYNLAKFNWFKFDHFYTLICLRMPHAYLLLKILLFSLIHSLSRSCYSPSFGSFRFNRDFVSLAYTPIVYARGFHSLNVALIL